MVNRVKTVDDSLFRFRLQTSVSRLIKIG